MINILRPPIIVGAVTLDVIRSKSPKTNSVDLRFGGVCNNVACSLGVLGFSPRFVTVTFSGEVGAMVPNHLKYHGVVWYPLPTNAPLAYFEAQLDTAGEVESEQFHNCEALELLTVETLRAHNTLFDGVGAILGCTDLSIDALMELQEMARDSDIPFWLLVTSDSEVEKIRGLRWSVDLLGMNRAELERFTGRRLPTHEELRLAMVKVAEPTGACLVTLGAEGALLYDSRREEFLYRPAIPFAGGSSVGAGDVFFACLFASWYTGKSWYDAMSFAGVASHTYLSRDSKQLPFKSLSPLKTIQGNG